MNYMKSKKKIEMAVSIAAAAATLLLVHFYSSLYTPASSLSSGKVVVVVPRGSSFRVVSNNLEEAGVIRDSSGLAYAAALLGAHKMIKAGEYELAPTMTPMEIVESLVEGRTKVYSITFPEGYNIKEMAGTVEAVGLSGAAEFTTKARDKAQLTSFGLEGETFEGYLFPDTYRYTRDMPVAELIAVMVDRFKEVFDAGARTRADELGMTMREVVTLASIIEKETASVTEMPLISAVFHNRLRKGYRLQSDPTVIYGLKDFDGNLTKKHLISPGPYNTYKFYGLPQGPIANPGRQAIEAALYPSGDPYLYFVSRGNGTHYFSMNLAEHNLAVEYYQRRGGVGRPPGGLGLTTVAP